MAAISGEVIDDIELFQYGFQKDKTYLEERNIKHLRRLENIAAGMLPEQALLIYSELILNITA
ncbi:MAG TPA: hypothetical protein VHN59_14340 [Chitinophagaceae bacterium]|nr:hypothetical protein [Chitinophagaceae bacterium]